MLSGLLFVLALCAVGAVLVWSIKFENVEGAPHSGFFAIRKSFAKFQGAKQGPRLPTKKQNLGR